MTQQTGVWQFNDPREWLNHTAKQSLPPLIITAAITGGGHGKEMNPNLPETAEEQAEQAYECYKLGASIAHVHARVAENPAMVSGSPARYREINALIRDKCPDIIINNTTGGGPQMSREERMASIEAGPEICSLNMGPLASRGFLKKRLPPLSGRPDDVILDLVAPQTTFGETEMYAKAMAAKGIKPEMEVYNHGQWWLVHNLIDQGLVKPPYLIQFVMGFPSGALPTPKNLLHLVETAPMPSVISVIGIGLHQTAMVTLGILLGLNVRTGMEDNIFISRGQLCTGNAQLVEKVVRLARELGREIATPKQARQMLGLSETPSRYY